MSPAAAIKGALISTQDPSYVLTYRNTFCSSCRQVFSEFHRCFIFIIPVEYRHNDDTSRFFISAIDPFVIIYIDYFYESLFIIDIVTNSK